MSVPHAFDHLSIEFYAVARKDRKRSTEEGRPIYKEVEMFRARIQGDPTRTIVAPAHDRFLAAKAPKLNMGWASDDDDEYDEDAQPGFLTYAQAFPDHYAAFKKTLERTTIGTPIEHLPFLSKRRIAELKARNVESVEGLASLADRLLSECGPTTRDEREMAKAWLDKAGQAAVVAAANAEKAAMAAEMKALQEKVEFLLEAKKWPEGKARFSGKDDVEDWSDGKLRAYLTDRGVKVRANQSHEKLVEAVRAFADEEMPEVVEEDAA